MRYRFLHLSDDVAGSLQVDPIRLAGCECDVSATGVPSGLGLKDSLHREPMPFQRPRLQIAKAFPGAR